ncbi:aminopeptidase N-like [Diaphorina citri]|uniref:Aminopeptidase N-like n=1 Tax=Diaphorina citri TaxID=121845 RepID=A0A1S3CTM3_DIACI|nr:aminopeptidase N-like [Diaphorina citri]
MRNWVSNEGFPVLHVTRDEKKRDHLKFRQEWFHYEIPKGVSSDDDESQWYIPVTLTTLTNTDFNDTARFWLDRREYKYRAHGLEEDAWVIVNLNFGGFYRVNYDLPNWSLLTKEIHRGSSSVLQPITQGQLMDDAFALARAGMLSYEVPLDMSKSLKDHWTYVTWMTVLNNVRYFKNILIHEKHSMIEEVLRKLTTAAYDQLSYELSLSYSEELLLSEISEWSCRLSVHACVSKVNKTYHENGYDLIKAMHTDQMINTILCTVVRESNDKEFNTLWESLNTTDDKYPILLKSLSCSKNQTKVFEVLDKILDESSTHLSALWSQLSSDPDTAVHMFTWFQKVNDRSVLGKIVTGCTEGLTTTAQLLQTDLAKSWPNEELKFLQRKAFALHADSLYNTRSVLNNSEESVMSGDLYSRLGSLTYSKGVFILDMLRSAISEHAYTKAVQSYLKSWNTANANEMDFAETLNGVLDKPMVWASNSTRKNLTHVMRNWVSNEGNTANANEMDFAETLNGVLDKPMVWASNSTRKNLTHVMRNWVSNEGFPVLHVTRDEKKRDHLKFRQTTMRDSGTSPLL